MHALCNFIMKLYMLNAGAVRLHGPRYTHHQAIRHICKGFLLYILKRPLNYDMTTYIKSATKDRDEK